MFCGHSSLHTAFSISGRIRLSRIVVLGQLYFSLMHIFVTDLCTSPKSPVSLFGAPLAPQVIFSIENSKRSRRLRTDLTITTSTNFKSNRLGLHYFHWGWRFLWNTMLNRIEKVREVRGLNNSEKEDAFLQTQCKFWNPKIFAALKKSDFHYFLYSNFLFIQHLSTSQISTPFLF